MSPAEVMSLGVPTWGPAEQVAILEELGPVLRPERVVFVANLANDWVEAHVENRRRHTARDGWARRVVSGAKAAPWSFPGRRWLLGRSHLALLTRQAGVALAGELPVAQAALRLAKEGAPVGEGGSVITPFVEQAAGWCRAHGCELVVAALPLDVQVHPGEWAKYRTPPADVSTGTALTAQLLSDLEARSVPAVDLLPPLRRASPGAFLDDDYHLSARGHRAVAEALLPRLVDSASDSASAGLRPGGPS